MLLPFQKSLADLQELDSLPEKIAIIMTSVSEKNRAICFMFELWNLHLHVKIVCSVISCHSTHKMLPRNRFILMSGSKKLSLLMEQSTSSRFVLVVQSFSCSL